MKVVAMVVWFVSFALVGVLIGLSIPKPVPAVEQCVPVCGELFEQFNC